MNYAQPKPPVGILAAASIALLLMLYAAAYVALGVVGTANLGAKTIKVGVYSYEWQEYLFRPAAKVESVLTSREIETGHSPDQLNPLSRRCVTDFARCNEREEAIGPDEYERAVETVRSEFIDITDRAWLVTVRERGYAEVTVLQERNRAFKQVCDEFYRSRPATDPFENLNE